MDRDTHTDDEKTHTQTSSREETTKRMVYQVTSYRDIKRRTSSHALSSSYGGSPSPEPDGGSTVLTSRTVHVHVF